MNSTTQLAAPASRAPLAAAHIGIASGLRRWLDRRSERKQMKLLLDCDDHVLNDIGVSRAEVRLRLGRSFG